MGEEGEWSEEEGEGVEWGVECAGYGRCCQGAEAVEVMTTIATCFIHPSACRRISFHATPYQTILYNNLIIHVLLLHHLCIVTSTAHQLVFHLTFETEECTLSNCHNQSDHKMIPLQRYPFRCIDIDRDGHRKICVPSADTCEHWLRASRKPKKSILQSLACRTIQLRADPN